MESSIGALISVAAARYGEKTALVIDGRSDSFTELDLKSSALAEQLRERGICDGSVASISGQNSAAWIFACYGIDDLNRGVDDRGEGRFQYFTRMVRGFTGPVLELGAEAVNG